MLRSSESHNEADDNEEETLELLKKLEPRLKASWDANSAVYNAELTASLLRPGQPGYEEQEREIAAARFMINSRDLLE